MGHQDAVGCQPPEGQQLIIWANCPLSRTFIVYTVVSSTDWSGRIATDLKLFHPFLCMAQPGQKGLARLQIRSALCPS